MSLTEREKRFCQEYLVSLSPRTAAKNAGYSRWRTEGPKLFEAPKIQEYIQTLMDERSKRVEYGADDLLRDLVAMAKMDLADIMYSDGTFKPLHLWPETWRTAISSFEVIELKSQTDVAGFLKKAKLPDRLKILELIGRHISVSAFRDNMQLSANLSGIDALHAMRVKDGVS